MSTTEAIEQASSDTSKYGLKVTISETGPCRKKVEVTVPEADIARTREQIVVDYCAKANINGFRVGRVPRHIVESRFRQQLLDELKQRVLVASLEQLTLENEVDPINEPDMDVENIDIPTVGDFTYSFEVEVRPNVQIPDYAKLLIKKPVREITDADVDKYLAGLLTELGTKADTGEPAAAGDSVTVDVEFEHGGKLIRDMKHLSLRLQPTLRFRDGEIAGFDQLLAGAKVGDTRNTTVVISKEAGYVPMRGETLNVTFKVTGVQKFAPATLTPETIAQIGSDSEEALRKSVRTVLERQVVYRQRQSCRTQLLEQMTESTTWDLPETLVLKQVENALHREILEMKQAGYTSKEIKARENELRQNAVSVTRQAMKEHFVLDKIATEEKIEVSPQDIDVEIMAMAFQSGESPRRVRARLEKTRVIENLEAQIRERKAVDIALERAKEEEVPLTDELVNDLSVESVDDAICNVMLARSLSTAAS